MNFDQYRNEVEINPTVKSQPINQLLDSIIGRSRIESVKNKSCVSCNDTDVTFKDELSVIEYSISVLCQKCQDSIFGDE